MEVGGQCSFNCPPSTPDIHELFSESGLHLTGSLSNLRGRRGSRTLHHILIAMRGLDIETRSRIRRDWLRLIGKDWHSINLRDSRRFWRCIEFPPQLDILLLHLG